MVIKEIKKRRRAWNICIENMPLLRNLRIKEMMNSAKSNDPAIWPFK